MRGKAALAEVLFVRCFAALALVVIALTGSPGSVVAQTVTPNPVWSFAGNSENAEAIGTDAAGNIYFYGQFSGIAASMGGISLPKSGSGTNLWVAKVSPAGQVQWAKSFGGATVPVQSNPSGSSYGMAVDPSGNVYFAAYFGANTTVMQFGAHQVTAEGSRTGVVVKLAASDGSALWATGLPGGTIGGAGAITPYGVALDAANNPVVSGTYSGSTDTTIGGNVVTRIANTDLLVAKLNGSTGAVTWVKNFGGNSNSTVNKPNTGVDPAGNVYITGTFSSTSGAATLVIGTTLTRTASSDLNFFLVKLDSSGTPVWAKNYGAGSTAATSGGTQLNGMAVDNAGNSHFVTSFGTGNVDFGTGALTKLSTNSTDMVVVKVDTAGNTVWAKNFGTAAAATTTGLGVALDSSGNVYASGQFGGTSVKLSNTLSLDKVGTTGTNGLVVRLDSNGNVVWGQAYNGSPSASTTLNPVAISGTNVVVTGTFSGPVKFGSLAALNPANGAVFLAAIGQTTVNPTPPTPTPVIPVPPPSFVSTTNPPPTVLNANTSGSGQGTVSLASSFSDTSNLTFTATQSSGAALPSWLTFNPSTVSFTYNVPLPSNLPIQPSAADVSAGATERAVKAGRSIVNTVYPLAVLVQTVPVALTATGNGQSYTASVAMDFYAPRSPVAMTAVSYSAGGSSGNAVSARPSLSWDGGQVVFETLATNIDPAALGPYSALIRYHGLSGRRDLLSQTAVPGGGVANSADGNTNNPAVAAAGNYAAFSSAAPGVSATANNRLRQVYRTSLAYPRVALNEAATPAAVMISTTAAGIAADAAADLPSISEQGTFVAFESAAGNIGANPNRLSQIWRKDAGTGAIVLVSSTAGGVAGDGDSRNVSLSWDGNVAVFDSTATNLAAGGSGRQIFYKVISTGAIYRLGVGSNPKLDARGSSVVYVGSAGGKSQVMRYDIATGATTVVSVTQAGIPGNGDSTQPTVSADGRFVAFRSVATDLAAGYADNGYQQVWIRDVMRGQTALVTQTEAGAPGTGNSSDPALSGDGSSIGFASLARDLVNGTPLPGQIHLAANPLVLPGRTGYWYTTDGGNLTWSVERWGDKALIAGLAYNANGGTAVWAAGSCTFTGLVCQGSVSQWTRTGAAATPVGPVTLTFTADGKQASFVLGGAAARSLALYPVGGTRTTGYGGLPQNGYWGVAGNAAGVTSLFIDTDTQVSSSGASTQATHVTLFGYDAAGNAQWYAAEGNLATDGSFSGQLYLYSGGSTWSGAGSNAPSSTAVGTLRLSFTGTDRATAQLPDGRSVAISRWRF